MKTRKPNRFCPQLETLEDRWCPSTARPIADFLSAQGTTSAFPNGANPGGPAGLPDALGWGTSSATFANGTAVFARVDYTGQDAAFLHLNLGTTTSGTISERILKNGTVQDTVNLHTHNAFAWAVFLGDGSISDPPVLFGYLPSQLAADSSLVPPVVDSNFKVVIDMPYAGAPLPDLVKINMGTAPGYAIESSVFNAHGQGSTPTGQPATLVISQNNVGNRTPNLIRDGGWTAEVVAVQTNNGPTQAPAPATTGASSSLQSTPLFPATGSDSSSLDTAAIDAAFATGLEKPLV